MKCPIRAYRAGVGTLLEGIPVAVARILRRVRSLKPRDPSLTIEERDNIIRARWLAGTSQAQLGRDFGISYQRIHQIIHDK